MAGVLPRKIFKRMKKGAEVMYASQGTDARAATRSRAAGGGSAGGPAPRGGGIQIPADLAGPMVIPMAAFQAQQEPELERIEGMRIPPEGMVLAAKRPKSTEDKTLLKISYAVVPRTPKPNQTVYAYCVIRHEPALRTLMYYMLEPNITEDDWKVIREVQRDLEERLDVDVSKLGYIETKNILLEEVDRSLEIMGFAVDAARKDILLYYIERDTLGFGKIDALMKDPNIEDLSCDGVGVPLYAYYRDPRVGSVRTNVAFETAEELDAFIVKLSQKCNKTISVAEPLLDGTLTDGSRIQATLGSDISRKGSNFTIRKFTEMPLTPTHMLNFRTVNALQLAYLWLAIDHGKSVLVSGGTATGKTSMLNVLSLFIRPGMKVVSIEDTAEIRLPHEHWVSQVARSALSSKGTTTGEVTLFDLLRASLRQRPDYIILGEVRGKEAFVLFQQMATGHASLATIHAASVPQLIDRLITPPISLPPRLLENIDVILFIKLSRLNEKIIRRADTVAEVVGIKDDKPVTRIVFEWDAFKDVFNVKDRSVLLKDISKRSGLSEEDIIEELFRRKAILEWMQKKGMIDYREVAKVIHSYYLQPAKTMDMIMSM